VGFQDLGFQDLGFHGLGLAGVSFAALLLLPAVPDKLTLRKRRRGQDHAHE